MSSADSAAPRSPNPRAALVEVGHSFHRLGWLRATGGNLSVRLDATTFAITASGVSKGRLTLDDFLDVDVPTGMPTTDARKPSAETDVHTSIYAARADAGAVLHVHSPHVAVFSRRCLGESGRDGTCRIAGYEFVKALGFWDEDAEVHVPVVPNHHHIPTLALAVEAYASGNVPGVWVAGHGLYAWGATVADAERHVEAFEELARYQVMDAALGPLAGA